LQRKADRIGYPVLIKTSDGGSREHAGGGTIRRFCSGALASYNAKRLGLWRAVLKSKIRSQRHIEIRCWRQRGNFVYLFERDCSVQRRHQKCWKKRRAQHDHAMRQQMGRGGCRPCAVNYVAIFGRSSWSNGLTAEFLHHEMNTGCRSTPGETIHRAEPGELAAGGLWRHHRWRRTTSQMHGHAIGLHVAPRTAPVLAATGAAV
jgi:acetyl/propionyl-CoA carboxylase alpha subunit